MKKRSQVRPSLYEREQGGCISGLISIFDFRHGRMSRKLLADKRRSSRRTVGGSTGGENLSTKNVQPSPNEEHSKDLDGEECKAKEADVIKTSVKKLMEEDMVDEQTEKNPETESGTGLKQNDSGNGHSTKKKNKQERKIHNKSCDLDFLESRTSTDKVHKKSPLETLDLEIIMEELSQKSPSSMKLESSLVEEKLVEAIKAFIEQKLSNGKRFGKGNEVKTHGSKELIDALEKVSSNKDSCLKLLQDPNSTLVKHIKNLDDTRLEKGQKPSSEKPDEFVRHKNRNLFRRRSKSLESFPFDRNENEQSSNKIVILKPGPSSLLSSPRTDIDVSSTSLDRSSSHFSFTEIKKRLKHAMGKERKAISPDGLILKSGTNGENVGWKSPNRNHFYTERFAKSTSFFNKGGKSEENGSTKVNEPLQSPRRRSSSNIYVEAKKHLSEILENGDANASDCTSQQNPKSLGRILSLSDYSDSPCCSPRKYGEDMFITAQSRLSPRGIAKNNAEGHVQESEVDTPIPSSQDLESQPDANTNNAIEKLQCLTEDIITSSENNQASCSETQSMTEDVINPEVPSLSSVVGEVESELQEKKETLDLSGESITEDTQDVDIEEAGDKEISSPCSKPASQLDSFAEDLNLSSPTMYPSPPAVPVQVENPDYETDKVQRASPVSVLEPLFEENDTSPASTTFQPVGKEIQPRKIHFEECPSEGIHTRASFEDGESAFEYIEAVLLGSGLDWNDYLLRWLSMYQILDPSLFDEVELFSSRSGHDQKLLFDCANEVLRDVCEVYFGCSHGISFVKQNIRPVPKGMNLINEVWEKIEWHLGQTPSSHSLDQLVKRDMARCEKWMDLRADVGHIGAEMGETIFNELVEDTFLSLVNDTSSELVVLQDEANQIEGSVM